MVPVFCASFLDVEPGLVFWTLITFICLAFLLRWKAWGPILRAVDEREKSIREAVEGAKRDREEAQRLMDEHRRLVSEARREGAETVHKALAEAEVARQDMIQKSRKEAEEIVAQAKRQIDEQVKRARAELSEAAVDLAMDAAEKVLGEALSDPQRQRKLAEQYVRELAQQPPIQRQA
jgi:F-type H+-transporting ATPase subunit b